MNAPVSARHLMSAAASRAVRPRGRLTVSQWADNHRKLSSKGSNEVGNWRTARNPILREIMDCLSLHSPVREITVMKSSQVGVTDGPFICSLGYYMEYAPCPVMVFMPTLEARDTWKVQKFNPLLTETPIIRNIMGGLRSRDAQHSKDVIEGPGFIIFLAGGNSPNSYAQKSAKVVEADDLDRFTDSVGESTRKVGDQKVRTSEGDPVELMRSRFKSFPNSYKFLKASTPTIKDASLIEREFNSGDGRRYHIECPSCGEFQVLKWSNVKANVQMTEAWYVCEHNGCIIHHQDKAKFLPEMGHGGTARWIPERPEITKHRSYHISALYAPIGLGPSWLDLMIHFKRVHKNPQQLMTFINSNLGECWEDRSAEKLKTNELQKRAGNYTHGEIPPGCLVLTMGVDTQDKWLAYKWLGWGAPLTDGGPMRHWIIKYGAILGDTTGYQVWDDLEAEIHLTMVNSYGKEMRLRAVGIDSRGHRGEQVKNFVMRPSLKVPVYAVQGSTTHMGRAIAQTGSYPNKGKTGKVIKHGYCTWNIGTEHCKDYLFGNLVADADRQQSEYVINFPQGLEVEYYDGLISEVYDPEKKRYIPRVGAKYKRNEPLDCFVYAWAIGQHRDINIGRGRSGRPDPRYWERLAVTLEGEYKVEKVEGAGEEKPRAIPAPMSDGKISLGNSKRFGR